MESRIRRKQGKGSLKMCKTTVTWVKKQYFSNKIPLQWKKFGDIMITVKVGKEREGRAPLFLVD